MCWTLIDTEDAPAERFDHAMAVDHAGSRIYLFGGRGPEGFYSDLWVFNPVRSQWSKIDTDGGPSARSGSSLVFDPESGRLLLFGGFNFNSSGETKYFRELWTFSQDGGWEREFFQTGPVGRAWHAALTTREAMVIFGGFGGSPNYYLQDIWACDLAELSFRRIATDGGPLMAGAPVLLDQGGASSLMAFGPSSILAFGRSGIKVPAEAGLWSLQVEMDHWSTIDASGIPESDFSFTAADHRARTVLVGRGPEDDQEVERGELEWDLWTFSIGDREWHDYEALGGPHTPHGLACGANPQGRGGWICFGGARRNQVSGDTWLLAPCDE
jgi:hypothetical protein